MKNKHQTAAERTATLWLASKLITMALRKNIK